MEANFLDALRAESEQRALQISNLHQHLNQGLTQARAIQELHHEVAVADAAVARAAEEERAAQVRCGTVVPDARFAELKEWVNIELGRLRQQQQEQFQKRPSPPPYPNPKRGQQDGKGPEVSNTKGRIELILAEAKAALNKRMQALEEREETINRIEEQHTQQVKTLNVRLRALEEREESDKITHLNLAELGNQRDRDAEKLAEVRRELAAMAGDRSRDTMEQSTGVKKDLEDQRQNLTELEKELHRNCSDVRAGCSTALAAEHEKWVQGDR